MTAVEGKKTDIRSFVCLFVYLFISAVVQNENVWTRICLDFEPGCWDLG